MAKASLVPHPSAVTNLESDETVVLYPTFGYRMPESGSWRITISGTVYEPEKVSLKSRILVRLLKRVLGGDDDILRAPLFQDRVRHFTAATEKGKRIAVRIGGEVFQLPKKSRKNGRFTARVLVNEDQIARWERDGHFQDGWLEYEVVPPRDDNRAFSGRVQLIEPQGLSVISDIDDTLKHTFVRNRREMLARTFLLPFEEVDGMAELYRTWADQGTSFHYVSSSPWQLFTALEDFRSLSEFPNGSVHLRSFRLRDHMLRRLLLIRRKGKGAEIRSILRRFPERSFILVGDSGERDPEIYGAVARRFPEQVQAIYIRELDARPMGPMRIEKAFRRLDEGKLRMFRDAIEIEEELLAGV